MSVGDYSRNSRATSEGSKVTLFVACFHRLTTSLSSSVEPRAQALCVGGKLTFLPCKSLGTRLHAAA